MNKVRYRNDTFIKRKRELINKILSLTGHSWDSPFARSLQKKTSSHLEKIYWKRVSKRL